MVSTLKVTTLVITNYTFVITFMQINSWLDHASFSAAADATIAGKSASPFYYITVLAGIEVFRNQVGPTTI
jgi:hypothetical protein